MKNKIAYIKNNLQEIYTIALISIGIPGTVFLYFGAKAAFASFVLSQTAISLIAMRYK